MRALVGDLAVPVPGDCDGECPSSSETVCSGTPAASMSVANECLSVCSPTPLMPKALAAVPIARRALLGSTAVPLSMVKTRPAHSALERPRTKDVRRATSPFDALFPGERCGRDAPIDVKAR